MPYPFFKICLWEGPGVYETRLRAIMVEAVNSCRSTWECIEICLITSGPMAAKE